jgi:hypothetical protein
MEADQTRRIAMSYPEPFDLGLPAYAQTVLEGDIVSLGPSGALTLEVMAVRGDKAWVRDLDDGRDGVVDIASFRRFGLDASGSVQ